LACPARFERATYALEEFVAAEKSNKFNSLANTDYAFSQQKAIEMVNSES